jgi:hypothetical protein
VIGYSQVRDRATRKVPALLLKCLAIWGNGLIVVNPVTRPYCSLLLQVCIDI